MESYDKNYFEFLDNHMNEFLNKNSDKNKQSNNNSLVKEIETITLDQK